jgi:hypothetical protein
MRFTSKVKRVAAGIAVMSTLTGCLTAALATPASASTYSLVQLCNRTSNPVGVSPVEVVYASGFNDNATTLVTGPGHCVNGYANPDKTYWISGYYLVGWEPGDILFFTRKFKGSKGLNITVVGNGWTEAPVAVFS